MKILLFLATLTFIASCAQPPATSPTPSPLPKVMEETKIMKDDAMMETDKIKNDIVMTGETMKDDKMMSGSWTPEEMKAMEGSGMMMDHSGMDMMKKDEAKMMKSTGYMNYDEAKVKEALASGQKVALFFHASWCPSCRALDSAINSSLSSIPQDTFIVKVDYDTNIEMKKKYGVTSQHTTVLIDKDMALISKKLGAKTVNEILN